MPTANAILQDRAIRHAILVHRYGRKLADEIVAFLNDDLQPQVLATLEKRLDRIARRGFDTGLHSTQRLKDLRAEIADTIKSATSEAAAMARNGLVELAKSEAAWNARSLRVAIPETLGVGEPVLVDAATLRVIVDEGPINGALLKDWFKAIDRRALESVTKAVNVGLSSGETTAQIVARARGTVAAGYADGALAVTRNDVQTAVQTATAQVSSRVTSETARANADIVQGERWVATLDTKTCPVCAGRDGKVYEIEQGERPPAHPKCRCVTVPYLKAWDEIAGKGVKVPPGTRASMDGQVPDTTTFEEWLRNQPPDRVATVLGSKRAAKKFLAGDVQIGQFSSKLGKPLSLKQVEALDAD